MAEHERRDARLYGCHDSDGSMTDRSDRVGTKQTFERLAAEYDHSGETKPANAYLERPATRSLLPDVDELVVLDAGCGAGHLAREIAQRGAIVVGFDASLQMLCHAQVRAPMAHLVQGDLGELPFGANEFDGIVSSLAFHYVRDWEALFQSLHRILKPDGWIVFSVQHPHANFEEYAESENYHEIERVSATWDSFGEDVEVEVYRRPLSAIIMPALSVGFDLDQLVEPTPTAAYRRAEPDRYEYEATHPNFLCIRISVVRDLEE